MQQAFFQVTMLLPRMHFVCYAGCGWRLRTLHHDAMVARRCCRQHDGRIKHTVVRRQGRAHGVSRFRRCSKQASASSVEGAVSGPSCCNTTDCRPARTLYTGEGAMARPQCTEQETWPNWAVRQLTAATADICKACTLATFGTCRAQHHSTSLQACPSAGHPGCGVSRCVAR
jgi:hypothetical protein